MRPPGRGDFWILKIAHGPSPKNLSKNGFCPRKGVAFLWKAFLQKNFPVREKIPLSALAFGCSHALLPRGLRSRRPHSSLISGLLGLEGISKRKDSHCRSGRCGELAQVQGPEPVRPPPWRARRRPALAAVGYLNGDACRFDENKRRRTFITQHN
jgi:hypothetical protein